jgi:RimJ/RimL family protein N-acetyltransferase
LRTANPGNWHDVEWHELLDGRLGPWTIVTEGDHAISICHTPRPVTERAAECGVWTDSRFRGRGYAAATAAAWVALVRAPQRYLFYSTEFANLSSQRVAQRLQLRPLGWTWRLHTAREDPRAHWHPLSSLCDRARP